MATPYGVHLTGIGGEAQLSSEADLREKLQKIEALFAGAGTQGERIAAEAALELCGRVRSIKSTLGDPISTCEKC